MNNNIENLLADWGISKRELPDNNLVFKNKLLNYPIIPMPESKKSSFRIAWFPLALSGLGALVLALQLTNTYTPSHNASFSLQTETTPSANLRIGDGLQKNGLAAGGGESSSAAGVMTPSSIISDQAKPYAPSYYPMPANGAPASDNREFLQTSYSANILSRHVQETTESIQTSIRGFGGRVDSSSQYSNSGYVSFVVPASKFDDFKIELKNLAGNKFITESSESQNMLPEKQSIESQQKQTQDNLNQLTTTRDQLTTKHNQAAASLNSQIKNINTQLDNLQTELDQHPERQPEIYLQQQALLNSKASLQKQLANENTNYAANFDDLNSQIQDNQSTLKNLGTQNINLLDQVATVQGTIYVQGINLWQAIGIYTPYYWPFWVAFAAVIIGYFLFYKKNRITIS